MLPQSFLLAALATLPSLAGAISIKAQKYEAKAAASNSHVVTLDSASYDDLTSDKGRDYAVTVLLTALDPQFKVHTQPELHASKRARDAGVLTCGCFSLTSVCSLQVRPFSSC